MTGQRTIVLALARYYLPGFKAGGPIRSISNLVERLGDEFDLRIVAADRDLRDDRPYSDVVIDSWNQVGNAQVYYLSAGMRSLRSLLRLISETPHDVLYLNSFFDPVFTQLPLWARRLRLLATKPIILAPRGELAPRSISRKAWKKVPFLAIASFLGLYDDLTWQASTEHEAGDIRRAMGQTARRTTIAPIVIAQDLPPLPDEDEVSDPTPRRDGHQPLRLVFLGRVSPSKNLDLALRILAHVRMPVALTIHGPIDDKAYWRACQRLMTKLPANVSVHYGGIVAHSEVTSVLTSFDLLFLPTRSENYGHVIIESMLAGTPVLIGDTTPWRDLEEAGVGWDVPLDNEQQFAQTIDEAAKRAKEGHMPSRVKVRSFARTRVLDPEILSANRRLFRQAAARD
jgi:glycosyltransferase involved in cell wall biosynthesis